MEGFKKCNIASNYPLPTTDDILKLVTDAQIFKFYIPGLTFNVPISSPLGSIDKVPSFNVFWSTRYNKYLFKDHRYGWFGDCFDFVRRLHNYETLIDACMKICNDFGIQGFYIKEELSTNSYHPGIKKLVKTSKSIHRGRANVNVTIREWNNNDIIFWGQYGITRTWLKYANIHPIKYFFINKNITIADKYAYVYIEFKDNKPTYKIYQPYAEHDKKWISNNDRSVWELWNMLPKHHDFLIITKSRKDALAIMSTLHIPSTSLQAEGTIPKLKVIYELKERFKNIFLLYDNDFNREVNYGRVYGKKLSDLFELPQIEIPEKYKEKDYSDLVKKYGILDAKNILWLIIKKKIIQLKI